MKIFLIVFLSFDKLFKKKKGLVKTVSERGIDV